MLTAVLTRYHHK